MNGFWPRIPLHSLRTSCGASLQLVRFVRYRFLIFAGLLPYVLGTAVALYSKCKFNSYLFLTGLLGLLFVLIGVEAFNEFFDWHIGTDRVFQLNPKPVPKSTFVVGVVSFFLAFIVAIVLTLKLGIAIIILSIIGFFAALFYLAPPVKLAYRGLGEITIALSYGPLMMLGSYYVQARQISILPVFVSLIPALLLFAISILNEVPDFFQDRLVGKKNICVRIGQKNTVVLHGVILIVFYIILLIGLISGILPHLAWLALICFPIFIMGYITGIKTYENPHKFIFTVRYMIIHYVVILSILITGYIWV